MKLIYELGAFSGPDRLLELRRELNSLAEGGTWLGWVITTQEYNNHFERAVIPALIRQSLRESPEQI